MSNDVGSSAGVVATTYTSSSAKRGHDGVRRDAERFTSAWSEVTVQVEDLSMCGGHVVADVRWVATATSSGVPVQMRLGALWTLVGAKVSRFEHHPDAASARRAASAMS